MAAQNSPLENSYNTTESVMKSHTTTLRVAQERLRSQANRILLPSARKSSHHQHSPNINRRALSTSSYEFFCRAVAQGNAFQVQTWLHKCLPLSPVAPPLAEPQRERLQRTLEEGFRRARDYGHDDVVRVLLEHDHPDVHLSS